MRHIYRETLILILLAIVAILVLQICNKKIEGSGEKPTFIVKSEWLDTSALINFLKDAEWKEINLPESPTRTDIQALPPSIDFMWLDGKYKYGDYRYVAEYPSYLKSFIAFNQIVDKAKLYLLIITKFKNMSKILPKSYIYDPKNANQFNWKYLKDTKYIIRPSEGFRGKGLNVASNKDELIDKINSNEYINFKKPIVISEYLNNLILFNGKIFHIRYYLFVGIVNGKFTAAELNIYPIATAQEKYDPTRETDKAIFDSHFGNTTGDNFLEELQNYDITVIKKNIANIIDFVKDLAKFDVKCYPESKNCYDLLGIDLMVQQNLNVKLLEINYKVSLGIFKTDANRQMLEKLVYRTLILNFLQPAFPELQGLIQSGSFSTRF